MYWVLNNRNQIFRITLIFISIYLFNFNRGFCSEDNRGDRLLIGCVSVDITPTTPVALDGQLYLRIANDVQTPISANIVALESKEGEKSLSQTIIVSADLIVITRGLRKRILSFVSENDNEIDTNNIIISATHTHTGPVVRGYYYDIPDSVISVNQTLDFISNVIGRGVMRAWNQRTEGSVTWGQGQVGISINRRAIYNNGSAKLYGETNSAQFEDLEGASPYVLNVLFFWDSSDRMIGTVVEVPTPSQVVEHRSSINADFWEPTRRLLKERFGSQLVVVGVTGFAGDQSPHLMIEEKAQERMQKLENMDRVTQIAKIIDNEIGRVYEVVKVDKHDKIVLRQKSKSIRLPILSVREDQMLEARKSLDSMNNLNEEIRRKMYREMYSYQSIVDRYEWERKHKRQQSIRRTIHAIRISNIVISTSPFEMFSAYGTQVRARSKALQTFTVELAGGGTYLPSKRAMLGGSYGVNLITNEVGAEAGRILVNETIKLIDLLWED